jgi:phosphatidylinositol-3,4,5-trisphosphate 3-phosphatase and dual-specificity protein phosphatase PTEN
MLVNAYYIITIFLQYLKLIMVEYIRSIVSGKKKRYIDTKYNLDLSYITSRVIAMAYPGSGLTTLYRNNINQVSDFLFERHGKNFLVFNLSGFQYDTSKFYDQVLSFEWLDHHAPQLETLFSIVSKMVNFAKQNVKNIVVVHCNAGKGRTGTVICCYLMFLNYFDTVEDCFKYYSKMRFDFGDAVTQPGQVRYVHYFHKLLKEKYYFPLQKTIKTITMKHIPLKEKSGEIRPFIEIYFNNSDNIDFTNKTSYFEQKKVSYNDKSSEDVIILENANLNILGDVTIKISTQYLLSDKKLGRISFNTAFSGPNEETLVFKLHEIDPDSLQKKSYVNKDHTITLYFKSICPCNNRYLPIKLCDDCKVKLKDHIKTWKSIHSIIEVSLSSKLYIKSYYLIG